MRDLAAAAARLDAPRPPVAVPAIEIVLAPPFRAGPLLPAARGVPAGGIAPGPMARARRPRGAVSPAVGAGP